MERTNDSPGLDHGANPTTPVAGIVTHKVGILISPSDRASIMTRLFSLATSGNTGTMLGMIENKRMDFRDEEVRMLANRYFSPSRISNVDASGLTAFIGFLQLAATPELFDTIVSREEVTQYIDAIISKTITLESVTTLLSQGVLWNTRKDTQNKLSRIKLRMEEITKLEDELGTLKRGLRSIETDLALDARLLDRVQHKIDKSHNLSEYDLQDLEVERDGIKDRIDENNETKERLEELILAKEEEIARLKIMSDDDFDNRGAIQKKIENYIVEPRVLDLAPLLAELKEKLTARLPVL